MNRFAVLDTSDNEEEVPKVSTQKKPKEDAAAKAPKKETVAKQPSKPSDNKPKGSYLLHCTHIDFNGLSC